ncbi:choloylglycine hydrolase family protein [Shewanella schlegeliana]|uniref:Choloylglycine hydrolase family protein n=1 Tax=Shewanella schlegeliana TaxID=190308 RepID=A0ABS1T283_9GAMM|nr:choloylglycine hydrolase family protein [Shewanella schlegeliana]MBL4914907.1 choloylglycine hydrolase family protein [Shewanella schlegeliana]MCL1110402.1 choloylglycine hydrolase family protein [Shewanella schlegeliana]GIU27823.1 choloylglycine hydrolase [Shewanella schlegeliana]
MKKSLLALVFASVFSYNASACTGITLSTSANDQIQARTIEWGHSDLNSKLVISPRNHQYTSTMPDQQQGLTWTSQYGFAGISVSDDRFIAEGINEKGLTAGLFYFRNYGSLAKYDPKQTANNITDMDFVRWMLTQFETVAEVEAALDKIKIVTVYFDQHGNPSPTAHWRVSDKQGNSIVIEIMDHGKIHIHKNTAKVLTNSPDYNWQVTNLNNYINLHPGISPPQKINGVEAQSFGVGSNFVGLPGDISPPSRFVRAAFYVNTAPTLNSAEQAVSQAFHILNNFDIPIGSEFNDKSHIPELPSATQWTSVIDQSHGLLFYKTMHDSTIKRVDLKQLDFNAKQEHKQKLDSGKFSYQEVTVNTK